MCWTDLVRRSTHYFLQPLQGWRKGETHLPLDVNPWTIKDVLHAGWTFDFSGYKIHERAQEGDEPSEEIETNFLTACEILCCRWKREGEREIMGIIIYSSTTWLIPKCPFFPWMKNAVDIAYYNETARPLLKITLSSTGYWYEKTRETSGKYKKTL